MALTPQERKRWEQIKNSNSAILVQSPKNFTKEEQSRWQSIKGSGEDTPLSQEGLLTRGANYIDRGLTAFSNLPGVKQLGQATGAVIGAPAAAISAGVSAVGTPIRNLIQGKPVTQDWGKEVVQGAKSGYDFGYSLGEQAPTLGLQQTIGRVPNIVIGAAQTYKGVNDTVDLYKEGDTAGALEAGVNTGIGFVGTVLGTRSGKKGSVVEGRSKGNVLAKPFVKPTPQVSGPMSKNMFSAFEPTGNPFQRFGKKLQMTQLKPTAADVNHGFDINNVSKYEVGGGLDQGWT
jgi:hypothetical protein